MSLPRLCLEILLAVVLGCAVATAFGGLMFTLGGIGLALFLF